MFRSLFSHNPSAHAGSRQPRASNRMAAGMAALLLSFSALTGRAQICAGNGPTLKTIAVDGNPADWSNVLSNPVQVTNDGEWLSPCTSSTDRDCAGRSIGGRDLSKFAWTYDNTNIYQYVQRYGSTSNTQTYYFYIDTNGNQVMNTGEKVLQIVYSGSNKRTDASVYDYAAVGGAAGDAMVSGVTGFADGYTLPGTLTGGTVIYSGVVAGFADGTGFESSIPVGLAGRTGGEPALFPCLLHQ